MTGCHISSYKLSDCIWHCFFDPRSDFMVPKASSKVKVVAVLRVQNRAQKWDPVFGACGKCANTKGPQKRVRNPTRFWLRFQENAGSDGDDIRIARLLMATAAMKNQTVRFHTTAIGLPDAVFTLLYSNPLFPPTAKRCTRARNGTRRSVPVLPRKPCSAGKVSWLNAQIRADLPRKSWAVPVFGLILGFVQLRAGFAENTHP